MQSTQKWHYTDIDIQSLKKNNDCKQKKDKSKPIWSTCISCCGLLIFFSFIVAQNVFHSYWDGHYACTHHRPMIKEFFEFFWLWKKDFLFFSAALLAQSRNRQQNRCILCVASLKHTAAGQSRPICCTLCKAKQNCWRHQARFLPKKPNGVLKFPLFFLHILHIWCSPVTALTIAFCTYNTQNYWIKCTQTYPSSIWCQGSITSRAKHAYP